MEAAIVFLPLLGAFVAGFFGRQIGDRGSQYLTCTLLIFSAVLSWIVFFDVAVMGNVADKIDLAPGCVLADSISNGCCESIS
jgi:NADH-quinone oxidoreductase subunit L